MNNPTIITKQAPFKHFCMSIGAIPTSYLDTLDYYETLLWLIKYLEETIIPTVNNNGEAVSELQTLYIELKNYVDNYFTNLDVQEEINNKLDEMVEDGTLQEIISTYLNANALWCFDTVEDMKQAPNLINGSFAKTLGYYSINDNGGATYKIRNKNITDIENGGNIIFVNNNLVAEINVNDNINIKQFGAYGDEIHDDTISIQNAIDYVENSNLIDTLYIPKGNFLVSHIEITQGINLIGENDYYSCFKSIDNNNNSSILELINTGSFHTYITKFRIDGNKSNNLNTNIHGILCNINVVGLGDRYTQFSNLTISRCSGYGIYLKHNVTSYDFRELRLDNISISTCKKGIFAESTTDSVFTRITANSNVEEGIYINGGNNRIVNCKCFWNGKGNDDILEDIERIPSTAFTETTDETPQASKTYYTRTGTGEQNYYYVYEEFTGDTFEVDTTYYELTTNYYKKYAGLVINGQRCIVDSSEFQDNFGDGIQVLQNNVSLQNISCDNNGLIVDQNNTPISYTSINKTQLYFGVYVNRRAQVIISGAFNNFRYNSIGASQLAPIGIKTSSRVECNIISNNNVYDDLYLITTDLKTLIGNINGKPFIYNVDFNNVTIGTDLTVYEDDYNGSFIELSNGIARINLTLNDNNNAIMPTDSSNRTLLVLPNNCRPKQNLNCKGYITGNNGYNLLSDVTINIAPNGYVTMRSSYNASNNRKGVSIRIDYEI